MIVMGLGGLWHGAGLSYLMWGLLHGVLLVLERPLLTQLSRLDFAAFRAARKVLVFLCVSMLWIFFKLPDFDHAVGYMSGMFTPTTNPNPTKLFYDLALLYSLPVMLQHLGVGQLIERKIRWAEPYLYGSMAALMYLEAGPETSFIYFQF
jgi:alginate O-acetyltransferase complex protein AlgI